MVLPIIVRQIARYIPKIINYQDRFVKNVYQRPFLSRNVNPAVTRGIRHGLAVGSTYEGFNTLGNFLVPDGTIPKSPKYTPRKFRKARDNMEQSGAKCLNYPESRFRRWRR